MLRDIMRLIYALICPVRRSDKLDGYFYKEYTPRVIGTKLRRF